MSNKYIELKFNNNNDYNIYVVNENKRIKLSNSNMLIMSKIIRKYPHKRINENTIIYPDLMPIMIKFYREQSKHKKQKVNKKKSKKVLPTIVLTISLYAMTKLISNDIDTLPENNEPQITTETNDINEESIHKDTPTNISQIPIKDTTIEIIIEDTNNQEETNQQTTEIINIQSNETTNEPQQTIMDYNEESNYDESYFYYDFDTPGDKQALNNATQYMDIFKKYERIYGIDANILCAISAQESAGIHKNYSQNGHATGLMQIENIWAGATIKAFNFDTNSYETITVDYSRIGELDYNGKIGAAIFQLNYYETLNRFTNITYKSEQIIFSLQKYNMGPGKMRKVLSFGENWMDNRGMIAAGDRYYFEHVLSRLDNYTDITVRLDDGSYQTTTLVNNSLEKHHSKI